jgi:hypothetical protein
MDSNNVSLRHALATLAYRAARAIRNAPPEFAEYSAGSDRTPLRILGHIGDLMDWGLSMANGKGAWNERRPVSWKDEVARFHATIEAFDRRLASSERLGCPADRLFQGPIADALTHVGQIAMLRRMAGCPMGGENYYVANIAVGRLGPDQAPPVKEF